jgi:hypothetical protein
MVWSKQQTRRTKGIKNSSEKNCVRRRSDKRVVKSKKL